MSCFEQGEVGIISAEVGKNNASKKTRRNTSRSYNDRFIWTSWPVISAFSSLISEGQEGIFIENMTEGMIFYRVCKNGKLIMIPLFYAGEKKILYFQDYHHVKQEDEITLLPHTEEYIFDGSEYDE